RVRRANERAVQEARRDAVAGLDCRSSALLALITNEWRTVGELMRDIRIARSPAFMSPVARPLIGNSLRPAIARTVKTPTLAALIERRETTEKHGMTALLVRRRDRSNSTGTLGQA